MGTDAILFGTIFDWAEAAFPYHTSNLTMPLRLLWHRLEKC
jgi:hypothetical protein